MRKPLFFSVETEPVPPELRWRCAEPPDIIGQQLVLAGKFVKLYTHRVGRRTWPCLRSLPMLQIECPHCERARAVKCYCPVIHLHPDTIPPKLFVLCGAETLAGSLKYIQHGKIITAAKARMLKPTWVVHESNDQSEAAIAMGMVANYVPERGDITRWLLHYWQWPELSKAFGEVYRESIKRKLGREQAELHKLSLMTGTEGP